MSTPLIIGIVLVKNEDRFIEQVLTNILGFCDKIIVTDNGSTDNTIGIVEQLASRYPKIILKHIVHPSQSHEVIEPYTGTSTWVFAVDGDELYDPRGLQNLKTKLLNGEFQDYWCLYGNVLNCTVLDHKRQMAKGYLAPPSRSMTKLYNFSRIESWRGCPERLHGGTKIFRNGPMHSVNRKLFKELSWEESYFRCLHMAFLQRSSQANNAQGQGKLNPSEIEAINSARQNKSWIKLAKLLFLRIFGSQWKNQKYRQGALVEKEIGIFFNTP